MGQWSDYKDLSYQAADRMGPCPYQGVFLEFSAGAAKEGLIRTFNTRGFHTNPLLGRSVFPLLHAVTGDDALMGEEPKFRKAAFHALIGLSHPLRQVALSGEEAAQARTRAEEMFVKMPSKGNLKFALEAAHALSPAQGPEVPFTLLTHKLRADGNVRALQKIDALFDRREEKVAKLQKKGRAASEAMRARARYGL